MKNKTLYYIWLLLLLTTVAFQSCISDSYGLYSGSIQKRELTMNLSVDGFTEVTSRASGVFAAGDKVYIDFNGYRGIAEYDGSVWTVECPDNLPEAKGGNCTVTYIEDAASDGKSSVSLSSASVVYKAMGTYTNNADKMSVTASLSPATARVHFRGASGTSITVKGLQCYSLFNKADFGLSAQTTNIALTVEEDGYTDYVYCIFASDNREITVVNGFTTYTRTFGNNVLKAGHSGYINIPTDENCTGWTSDRMSGFVADGSDYNGSDSNWNQKDADQDKNANINGSDYDGSDSDWNQEDADPNQDVDTPINGYVDDENWNPTIHNGHEYVDLGLSVKWATMNVGALRPEGDGHYFAWGEIYSKKDYSMETYKWCEGSQTTMTKYCTDSSYGTVDNKTTLDPEDDVAHVKWSGNWRMPTDTEQTELREKCTWTWTTQNGAYGRKVTGPNGNSIFLPAAGYGYNTYFGKVSYNGDYWSSSLHTSTSCYANTLGFAPDDVNMYYGPRFIGRSVRAVCP